MRNRTVGVEILGLVAFVGCERAPAPQPGPTTTAWTEVSMRPSRPSPPSQPASAGASGNGCGNQLSGAPPADRYRALTRGDDDERGRAALEIVEGYANESRSVVRRALGVIASDPRCPHLKPVTDIVSDDEADDATRSAAALALGVIARDFPCTFPANACAPPHDPIPNWSRRALEDCAGQAPPMVQRACTEALGFVPSSDVSLLVRVRDDAAADAMARVFAGRALTRITGEPSVTSASLEQLVQDARLMVSQ